MGKGFGYAKAILLGEHFVVYGLAAIGVALSARTEVEISKSSHMKIESSHADAKLLQGFEAIKNVMKIQDSFAVKIKSDVPMGSGLGSSAAVSVAFVRALSDEYGLNLNDEQVSAYAYEAEKVYHGTPSGIDNTLAAFGGAVLFQKLENGNIIKPLKIRKPLHVVIGSTGKKKAITGQIISEVKARKEKNPEIYGDLFNVEKRIVNNAAKAMEAGKLEELGELMNINHGLLSALGVSSRENEEIVQKARELGALGAKITGAGCGGSCVVLAKSGKNAAKITEEIKKMDYFAITSIVQ